MLFHQFFRFLFSLFVLCASLRSVAAVGNLNDNPATTASTTAGIWWCNFFPSVGSMMVYVVPAGQIAQTFVPNAQSVGSVNYGDCQYFPNWGTQGQIIQLASYLSEPINGNTFFQFTPITTTGGNGVSTQTGTIVYNTKLQTAAIPTLPQNSATNPEAENQNVFIASPLSTDPPNLANGYRVESLVPPLAFTNQVGALTVSWLLQQIGQITNPVRNFCFNFAPGIANTNANAFNVPNYAQAAGPHDFDVFLVGGASPNANFNGNTNVQSPGVTTTAPFFNGITQTVQVISTPATNGLGGFSSNGNLAANDITFSVFGGFHAFDFNAAPRNDDPGFLLMPSTANQGGGLSTQVGNMWWINGNHPTWSVTIWAVMGLGNPQYPYLTKQFTFSWSQQAQLAAYNAFLASQIQFAEKNNINPLVNNYIKN